MFIKIKIFYRKSNPLAVNSYFIGEVNYINEEELIRWLTKVDGAQNCILDNTGKGQALTLLVKRDSFAHENEVRLIYHEPDSKKAETMQIYQFKIKPNEIFTRITLDPRLTQLEYEQLKNEIREWGYKNQINQSNLYQSKKFTIKFKLR